jgi:hypothetical protein
MFGVLGSRIGEAFAARRMRRLLAKTPVCTLAELREDTLGRITGVAKSLDDRVLQAPLSGRACVYYSITIDGMRNKRYQALGGDQMAISFALDDGTEVAIVDPAAARVSSGYDAVEMLAFRDEPSPRAARLLGKRKIERRYFTQVRLREAVIEVDEAICVLGAGTREPAGGDGQYRDGSKTRLRLVGSRRFPLLISDDPASQR